MPYIIGDEKRKYHALLDAQLEEIREMVAEALELDDTPLLEQGSDDATAEEKIERATELALNAIKFISEWEYLWMREAEFRRALAEIYLAENDDNAAAAEIRKAEDIETEIRRREEAGEDLTKE